MTNTINRSSRINSIYYSKCTRWIISVLLNDISSTVNRRPLGSTTLAAASNLCTPTGAPGWIAALLFVCLGAWEMPGIEPALSAAEGASVGLR